MPIIGANFTEHQTQHVEIMRKIARSFNESPMVLKGGTALLLAYGLDRYSEDLDFDSTKPINPITRISQAVRATHFKIENIHLKKDTDSVKRWIIRYSSPVGQGYLKLEVSYRNKEIAPDTYHTVEGIQVYQRAELITQKLHAARNRSKVRDLFDLAFLAREYGNDFTPEGILELTDMIKEPDHLESRYAADHQDDSILKNVDLDELVLELAQSAEEIALKPK